MPCGIRGRAQRLFDGGSISREMLDKSQTAFRVAEAAVDQAQQRLRILEDGVRPERMAAQRAVVAQAEAAVAQVDAALRNSVVVVPFSGIVTVRHREPGETVSPGLPVLTLLDPEDRWVRIYVSEDRIGAVSLGQAADHLLRHLSGPELWGGGHLHLQRSRVHAAGTFRPPKSG